jgi:hypothetical protein
MIHSGSTAPAAINTLTPLSATSLRGAAVIVQADINNAAAVRVGNIAGMAALGSTFVSFTFGVNGTGYDFGPYLGTYYCAYPTVSYISNYTYRIACTFPGGTYTEPDVGWARNTNMTGKGFRVTGWQLELASSVSPYVAANGTPVALSSAVWAQQGQFGTAQVNLLQAKFPTSCTGLSSGMWYDNAGTLTKCP